MPREEPREEVVVSATPGKPPYLQQKRTRMQICTPSLWLVLSAIWLPVAQWYNVFFFGIVS